MAGQPQISHTVSGNKNKVAVWVVRFGSLFNSLRLCLFACRRESWYFRYLVSGLGAIKIAKAIPKNGADLSIMLWFAFVFIACPLAGCVDRAVLGNPKAIRPNPSCALRKALICLRLGQPFVSREPSLWKLQPARGTWMEP